MTNRPNTSETEPKQPDWIGRGVTCLSSASDAELEALLVAVWDMKNAVVHAGPGTPWPRARPFVAKPEAWRSAEHLRSWWNAAEGLGALIHVETCWRAAVRGMWACEPARMPAPPSWL